MPQKKPHVSVSAQRRKAEAARRVVELRRREKERAAALARLKEKTEAEEKIRTIRAAVRVPLPVAIIMTAFVCTAMFMYIIFNTVQITEQQRAISILKKEINALAAEKSELESEIDKRNDLRYIEEYATNKLGMVKSDQLPRYYVNIENEDKIEIVTDESGSGRSPGAIDIIVRNAGTKLSELWEYIS